MNFKNSFKYKIFYADTDAGGVLYYAKYFELLEKARTEFLEQSGVSASFLHNNKIFFAVRKIKGDYLKPVFYGESIEVIIKVAVLKKSNFTLIYNIFCNNNLVFTGETVLVCVDSSLKIIKIPDKIYEFLKKFIRI